MAQPKALSTSLSKATKRTSIKHNNREFSETDWKNTYHQHIDRSRTANNVILKKEPIREKYQKLFGEVVQEYNNKQKRKDRQINDFYEKVKKSKKLELQRELIVQVGDKYDFENRSSNNWEIAKKILTDYALDFEKRNPYLLVYNAVIHLDEASPHLHLNIIPVAKGYQRGVQKQPSFDKALKQQGITSSNEDSRELWRNFRQQEIDQLTYQLRKENVVRKEVGTNKIKDVHEYKQVMRDLEQQKSAVEQLENRKEEIIQSLEDAPFIDLDNLKVPLRSPKKRIISLDDLFQLRSIQNGLKTLREDERRLKIDYERLSEENSLLKQQHLELVTQHDTLQHDNELLTATMREIKAELSELKTKEHDYTESVALKKALDKQESDNIGLEMANTDLIYENESLKVENSLLESKVSAITHRYDDLKEKLDGLVAYWQDKANHTNEWIAQTIETGVRYLRNKPKIKQVLNAYSFNKTYYIAENGAMYAQDNNESDGFSVILDTPFTLTKAPYFNKETQRYELVGESTKQGERHTDTLYLSEKQLLDNQPFSFAQSTDKASWSQTNQQSNSESQDQGWSR